MTQKRKSLGAATLLGEGKLVELAAWTGGTGVVPKGPPGKKKATEEDEEDDETEPLHLDAPPAPTGEPRATVVVVDHELSPRQLRHIEAATSAAAVLDRTGVIIEISTGTRRADRRGCRSRSRGSPTWPPGCARPAAASASAAASG